jgi:hypothetical protein
MSTPEHHSHPSSPAALSVPGTRNGRPDARPGVLRKSGGPAVGTACLALGALVILASGPRPTQAFAGAWTQVVCSLNSSQPVPIEGMAPFSPSGTTATNSCDVGGNGLVATADPSAPTAAGTAATWTYTAPPGSTITGGTITFSLYAPRGTAYIATPHQTTDPADLLAQCVAAVPCGPTDGTGELTETLGISHPGGTRIYAVASCAAACPTSTGLDARTNIYQIAAQLTSDAAPVVASVGGGLLASGAVHGVQQLSFQATEAAGPGIYNASATVDGKPLYSGVPDTNSGHCASAGTSPNDVTEFLYSQPCPNSVNIVIPVDTTQFADGEHVLRATVTDAAGNTTTAVDRTVTTANATTAATHSGPCNSSRTQRPSLDLAIRALGRGRLRFTGTFRSQHDCALGTAASRPIVLVEAKNGNHWQNIVTARVSPSGTFAATYGGGRGRSIGGQFSFRAVSPATPRFARATSAIHRARVR